MPHIRSNNDVSGIARLLKAIAADDRRAEFIRLIEAVLEGEGDAPRAVQAHENNPGRLPEADDTNGPRGTNFSCVASPRFIFVLGGSYRVVRDLDDRKRDRVVRSGEFYWMRSEGWNLVRNDTVRTVLSVIFDADHTRFLWYHHQREAGAVRKPDAHTALRYHTHAPASEELRHSVALMETAAACSKADGVVARSTARTLLGWCRRELLADEVLAVANTSGIGTSGRWTFDEIRAYVADHLQHELNREQVAEVFRLSADHLTRLFRIHAHCGFVEFVRAERFRLAERLLVGSRLSVKEIAAACGFNLSSYFIKRFRERHSVTPTVWRRLPRE